MQVLNRSAKVIDDPNSIQSLTERQNYFSQTLAKTISSRKKFEVPRKQINWRLKREHLTRIAQCLG